ncbi:DUF4249 domain-containing protein [Flavobacteriaceae bacterium F08102]|nr:DUF4249 domain-containing protein [Flavobacteriaceae bacterium F08102]
MKKIILALALKSKVFLFLVGLLLMASSCIEEFNATTESFESILVVEAGITDEYKVQEVLLSRTFRFEQAGALPEENADVLISDNHNNSYPFNEVSPGVYKSTIEFSAQPDTEYVLSIVTSDQKVYKSSPTTLIVGDDIEDVKIEKTLNKEGKEGVEISALTTVSSDNSKFYRYSYEETNLIIAPRWSRMELVVESQFPPKVNLQLKTKQDKYCYNTNTDDGVILQSSVKLNNSTSRKTTIKFIRKDDYLIANRYSILVKQHSISRAANTFYSLLKQFSSNGSLFTQVQTGFIDGNIRAENEALKVIGFFDVSSVSSKRVFFNFRDLFPNENPPELPVECTILKPELEELVRLLTTGRVVYYQDNECLMSPPPEDCDFSLPQGPYEVVAPRCGDCTLFGTNIKPDFWID